MYSVIEALKVKLVPSIVEVRMSSQQKDSFGVDYWVTAVIWFGLALAAEGAGLYVMHLIVTGKIKLPWVN